MIFEMREAGRKMTQRDIPEALNLHYDLTLVFMAVRFGPLP
jgi:hypothetical protein